MGLVGLYVRKVPTASGATAVQIAEKVRGKREIVDHIGSAHTPAELAAMVAIAKQRIQGDQQALDLGFEESSAAVIDLPAASSAVVQRSSSRILLQALEGTYERLGFDAVDDPVFVDLVVARLVEPTSKLDAIRVLQQLGRDPVHVNTLYNCLRRVVARDYRTIIATACWRHVTAPGGPGVALILYDLTTLYFEAEKEDGLRKVGMSKERRVDPQITVGLLVARDGFPLDIHVFEGNKAETKTLIPVITAFQKRHEVTDMVVVADAGMLSAANLNALEDAGLSFIVGSRTSKAPKELEDHFGRRGNAITDDGVVELTRPMRQGRDRRDRRVVWHYKWERAKRDRRTLNAQIDRAQRVADRAEPLKKQRFVKVTGQTVALNEELIERARQSAGYKGYVTNIAPAVMDGHAVVAAYHDLWKVEESFRMAKSDLKARPVFHRTRDSIEAHLTIVFTALAVARHLQNQTGASIKKIIQTLQPLRTIVVTVGDQELEAAPAIDDAARQLIHAINAGH